MEREKGQCGQKGRKGWWKLKLERNECVCVCAHIHIEAGMCACACSYMCGQLCVCRCVCVCMHMCSHVCMCQCACLCARVNMGGGGQCIVHRALWAIVRRQAFTLGKTEVVGGILGYTA